MADGVNTMAEQDDIVAEVKEFYAERDGAESHNRQNFADDLRFAYEPGAQWEPSARAKRQGRPTYSYNRIAGAINQLCGDQRKMRVSGKVRPETPNAAAGTAELFGGLIRDIEAASFAQAVYSEQFKYAAAGAWGAWRIVPEWSDEDSFEQVLRIRRIANPLTVYFDGQADPFGRGALQCVVADRITRTAYEAEYGDTVGQNVPVQHDSQGWIDDNLIRVAEYYKMTAQRREIALLSDGRVFDNDESLQQELERLENAGLEAPTIERTREALRWTCTWWKVDGTQILEGPIEYPYRFIPVIRLPGRHINIEGEEHYESLHRHGHDAARTYNYDRSSMVETVSLTPRAPYMLTQHEIKGFESMWGRSNQSNAPYLLFNPDERMGNTRPTRERGPEVPQAFIALAAHDAEDIRQTIGYTNPAVESQTQAGDAESGRALRTRLTANDSGSYEFIDHFEKAVQFTWRVLIDMIPVHYDTERTVRLLGLDGREQFQTLDPDALKKGKFDVTVTLGPAYATQRMEALDTLMEAMQRVPVYAELAPDLIARNMDIQGSDELEERVRRQLISRGIVQPTEEEKAQGIEPPPPDPQQEALVQRILAQAGRDKAETAKTNVETAEKMVEAESARQREAAEIANQVAETVLTKVEAMLKQQELLNQGRDNGGSGTGNQ